MNFSIGSFVGFLFLVTLVKTTDAHPGLKDVPWWQKEPTKMREWKEREDLPSGQSFARALKVDKAEVVSTTKTFGGKGTLYENSFLFLSRLETVDKELYWSFSADNRDDQKKPSEDVIGLVFLNADDKKVQQYFLILEEARDKVWEGRILVKYSELHKAIFNEKEQPLWNRFRIGFVKKDSLSVEDRKDFLKSIEFHSGFDKELEKAEFVKKWKAWVE